MNKQNHPWCTVKGCPRRAVVVVQARLQYDAPGVPWYSDGNGNARPYPDVAERFYPRCLEHKDAIIAELDKTEATYKVHEIEQPTDRIPWSAWR